MFGNGLNMNSYPLMESFVIEVSEHWTEMDVSQSSTKTYSDLATLDQAYPSYADYKLRDYYSIDLKSLLASCYAAKLPERKKSRNYPSSKGDGKDIIFVATCKIVYK
jgi:hypothetical protein